MTTRFSFIIAAFFTFVAVHAAVDTDSVAEMPQNRPADNVIMIEPLFQYPEAPDNLGTITDRSNWVLEHFWDNMDFNVPSVSQASLNHAFSVWVAPLRWADPKVAQFACDNLLKTLVKNPALLIQFTKAAEYNLFGDKADIWVDDYYMKFLDAFLSCKKVSELRKAPYKMQREQLANSMVGSKMPVFKYETPVGEKNKLTTETPFSIVVFGDPFCSDCSMYKVKLETEPRIKQWVSDGKVSVYYIVPDGESVEDWQRQLVYYPSVWNRGAGEGLDMTIDIRRNPSVYLLDDKGVICLKFAGPEAIANYIEDKMP